MRIALALLFFLPGLSQTAPALEPPVQQLIVGIAPDWASDHGKLQLFNKENGAWQPASAAWPVMLGKNGLAWGRGLRGQEEPGRKKVERDKRAPAGVFEIGQVFGYEAKLPPGANYPYHQVTDADVWSDDPRSPHYNQHMVIDPQHPPDHYSREKMRSGDFAYHWLIDIQHNEHPAVPGAGSAIFFHIRRGTPDAPRPTSGCTSMAESDLLKIIRWLRAAAHPEYVLLPWSEYQKKAAAWGLPSLEAVQALQP